MTEGAVDGGVIPTLSADDLVVAVPMLESYAIIETISFRNLPSVELKLDDILALSEEILHLQKVGVSGVVITQGTDTIEETAWALDLLLDGEMPVVVTGAMRNPSIAGSDGPANLLASVQVASNREARGLGTLVVFNDEIHAARFVSKTHTSNTATFQTPGLGKLGWVIENDVRILLRPKLIAPLSNIDKDNLLAVTIVTPALGEDGTLVQSVLTTGFCGLIIQAAGGGHTSGMMADALAEVSKEIPVVLCSRTGAGEVLQRTYGFKGAEIDLLRRGLVWAGRLDGYKARILLIFLLAADASQETIAAQFALRGSS